MDAPAPAFSIPDDLKIINENSKMDINVKKSIVEKCILSLAFCKNQKNFSKANYIRDELKKIYPNKSLVVIVDNSPSNFGAAYSYQKHIFILSEIHNKRWVKLQII